ncbi:hypothetical protein CBR_g55010 [Chara braunii]|uniref:Uncharacterized protein n=1 Tax=Chara braunii TaxID=69332 RepID=A0A388K7K2_CHABU|nr:hypothetical protein CBR_g55010 [Chara braunii]|eukprot:GBG66032.1 hypothetical protein CBR_g55010 [Chara braunii]
MAMEETWFAFLDMAMAETQPAVDLAMVDTQPAVDMARAETTSALDMAMVDMAQMRTMGYVGSHCGEPVFAPHSGRNGER